MVMRSLFLLVFALFLWSSCEDDKKPQRPEVVEQEFRPLIVEENGRYTEWYPGHQQIKISGRKNQEGQRTGVWKYFSEQGIELSITLYNNGLKEGHTIVKHPNGALRYTGEYFNDEPIGEWKFYNEEGQLIETKKYPE